MDNILFWKIWNNKFLIHKIFVYVRVIKPIDKNQILPTIKSMKGGYDEKLFLITLINKKEYSTIINRIVSRCHIHINKKSIRLLIEKCDRKEVFSTLFKYRRNYMERLDCIEESVKLDSVFALDTFIELYGGVEKVASTIIDPSILANNSTFQYTHPKNFVSLMDIAIRFSSLKVANHLLSIKALSWYTESKLLLNAFSNKTDYYSLLNADLLREIKIQKQRVGNYNNSLIKKSKNEQYTQMVKILNTKEKESNAISNVISSSILKSLKKKVEKTNTEIQLQFPVLGDQNHIIHPVDDVIEFIEVKLGHSVDKLVRKYHDFSSGNSHTFELSNLIQIKKLNKVMVVDLILDGFLFKKFINEPTIPFQTNYKQHPNIFKYIIMTHHVGGSMIHSIVKFLKSNREITVFQLLNYVCLNDSVKFPLFYKYYIDYHFYQSDFQSILSISSKLSSNDLNYLWFLIVSNFSITGYNIFKELPFENVLFDINQFQNYKINFSSSTKQYKEIEKFILRFSIDQDIDSFIIDPILILQVLFHYYPISHLSTLISKVQIFKTVFKEWITTSDFNIKQFYSNDQFDFDKLKFYFSFQSTDPNILNGRITGLLEQVILSNIEIDFISMEEKLKLLNYLN